jgi:hypothetical protein
LGEVTSPSGEKESVGRTLREQEPQPKQEQRQEQKHEQEQQ